MSDDRVALRIAAVGSHLKSRGYNGSVEITDGDDIFEWWCPHRHKRTDLARDCARRSIRKAMS